MERPRRLYGVLTDHRVDDEVDVLWRDRALDPRELLHQRLVDGETPGGVVDDDVTAQSPRLGVGGRADLDRILAGEVEHGDVELLPQHLELLDRGRSLHVGGDQQRALPLALEPPRELGRGGRLAGALQPHHHHPRAPARGEGDGLPLEPQDLEQLVVARLHEQVARGEPVDLSLVPHPGAQGLPDRLLLHAGEEALDDAQLDVGSQQGEPHLAQRRLDVLLSELRQPRQAVLRLTKPFGQRLEHGRGVLAQSRAACASA